MDAWTPNACYEVGDVVRMLVPRSPLDIWIERLTTFRWRVATYECREFTCI